MAPQNVLALSLIAVGMAIGQVLFKMGARALVAEGPLLHKLLSPYLAAGILLYGVTMLAWVWQLCMVDLSRAYPFIALAFAIVPLLGIFVLGETVSVRYWVGVACIILGIAIVQSAA